jgi:hypothetical protein
MDTFLDDTRPSHPRDVAPGHVIVLSQRGPRGVTVAGVFVSLADMRTFLRARGYAAGSLYTRHDVPLNPR